MKKKIIVAIGCVFLLSACTSVPAPVQDANVVVTQLRSDIPTDIPSIDISDVADITVPAIELEDIPPAEEQSEVSSGFDFSAIPEYCGESYVVVNNNVPYPMDEWEIGTEYYSPLDELGRCGVAYTCAGQETMPAYGETRGEIGMIKPSGWVQHKYEGLIEPEPSFIWNRSHILGWSISAENSNPLNLITGSRYMNLEMVPWETEVAEYIYTNKKNHVQYRVTPIFVEDELVCRGVLMEAKSVEDDAISYCVFVYNVQPGIVIDYATGENWLAE